LAHNPDYASGFEAVVKLAQEKNVAVQIIKTAQRRPWGEDKHWAATWYEPYNDQATIDLAIHYAMARQGVFLNTAGDIHVLPMVLDAANRFEKAPTDEQMKKLMKAQVAEPLWS
jgi:hypothetical protein